MKKIFFLAFTIISTQYIFAQTALEVNREASGTKILKGFINKNELAADTAFSWYAQNAKSFTPNADVVKQYSAGKDNINLVVFGGTWCGDTQALLPKFFATTNAAGITDNHITLIGVDRSKKSLFNLTETFAITNVPTFIVMKDGKEVGRVVEYGKTGNPEKEVAEIIAGTAAKK
ncbi:MAG: thioredoxin [Chitinophagaceae bacterium]|nr:MAG: thioredoxin [Chitinophagaceae bacterium]